MNQSTEMELRDLVQTYINKYPVRETIYIKIQDNTVRVGETISDVEALQPYPIQEIIKEK